MALTSEMGVVDLSFAPGKEQDLSDLPFDSAMLQGQPVEAVRQLNVTHAQLVALTTTPDTLLSEVLQFVTVLSAAHNGISNLRGIDAFASVQVVDLSHNALHVVDAHGALLLRTLRQLRSLDLSYNNMTLLDLDGSVGAPSSSSAGALSAAAAGADGGGAAGANGSSTANRPSLSVIDAGDGLRSLVSVNLAHNSLRALPNLRSAPHLETLNMSHNRMDGLVDLDTRLPLLALQSLALHCNQIPSAAALVPLCALAPTLKHVQVFRNPFSLMRGASGKPLGSGAGGRRPSPGAVNGSRSGADGALDASMWWRPFLLWLCPMLTTVDQAEFTASERRVAGIMLFREHGILSRPRIELMNPQRKDDLEAYLRRKAESAAPPADALDIIDGIDHAEDNLREYAGRDDPATPVVVPMSCVPVSCVPPNRHGGPSRGDSVASPNAAAGSTHTYHRAASASFSVYADSMALEGSAGLQTWRAASTAATSAAASPTIVAATPAPATPASPANAGGAVATAPTARPSASSRVVFVPTDSPLSMSPSASYMFVANHNRQRTQSAPLDSVVRALQKKMRTMEEVVGVLWRADLARRTKAAITIQRVVRGALARMRLSEEEAECYRFIRYQLQQAAQVAQMNAVAAAAAAQASAAAAAAAAAGRSGSTAPVSGGRRASQRRPSADPIQDAGANMQEVLLSMRSLQEVMGSMWVDLAEYRAMADREQRRAAVLIQRHVRGFLVRREYGALLHEQRRRTTRRTSAPTAPRDGACRCGAETAALRAEVAELRRAMKEMRALMQQQHSASTAAPPSRSQLAQYGQSGRAIDAIIRKHELRSAGEPAPTAAATQSGTHPAAVDDRSRSPSATPSLTDRTGAGAGSVSQEKTAHSSPRDARTRGGGRGADGDDDEVGDSSGRSNEGDLDSMPPVQWRSPKAGGSRSLGTASSLDSYSADSTQRLSHPTRITKVRPNADSRTKTR